MQTAERAARVRLLFLDVDGVLTDGRLYFIGKEVARAFHTLDGAGVRALARSGVQVALVSAADDGDSIFERAKQLDITRIHVDVGDKLSVVKQILEEENLPPEHAAYMGDDLPDLPSMEHVGFAIAPKTAAPEVLSVAHWTPDLPAGRGAVRQLCDLIMASRT